MKNKNKRTNRVIFSSSLFVAAIACVVATNIVDNNLTISQINRELTADSSTSSVSQFDHSNYFQMPEVMPTGFSGYNLLASTNNSQIIQTTSGVLGISKDNSTFFFTSYGGKIIWAQQFSTNSLVKKFYESQSWDLTKISNLTIKEWVKCVSIANRNILVALLNDGVNSIVTSIDLDTGLFYPSTDANSYNLDVSTVFVGLTGATYSALSEIGTAIVVSQNYDFTKDAKWLTLNTTSLSLSGTINATSFPAEVSDRQNVSFFGTGRFAFLCSVSKTYDATKSTNGEYYYNQYFTTIGFSGGVLTWSHSWTMPSYYITSSPTLNTSNWVNRFFVVNNNRVRFISGSSTHPYINDFTFTSASNCSSAKSLELAGDTLNSVAFGSTNNLVYFSTRSSTNNIYQYYVDCTSDLTKSTSLSTTAETNSYLVPILSNTDSNYLMNYNATTSTLTYNSFSGTTLTSAGTGEYGYWSLNKVDSQDVWSGLGLNFLPSTIKEPNLSPYYNFSTLVSGELATYVCNIDSYDDNNGTLKYTFLLGYTPGYNWESQEQFSVSFYVSNLYGINVDFVLNWLDNTTEINNFKTKYAIGITEQDIIDSFIEHNIKTKTGDQLVIDTSMINLTCSDDFSQLTVKISLPSDLLPENIASQIESKLTHTYTGFQSYSGYTIVQTNSDLTPFVSTIFPSELTNEQIVTNFLTIDSRISSSISTSDFDIAISEVNDMDGSLSITLSLNDVGKTKIPDFNNLPDEIKQTYTNIINNYKFDGFKSINGLINLSNGPVMKDILSDANNEYSPSQIWGQYKAYLAGSVNEQDVILFKNLVFDLTTTSNLEITCANENTCDYDKYLDLQFEYKENTEFNVDYSGKIFKKSASGKLMFSQDLIDASKATYPYKSVWNIASTKYFYVEDLNNGSQASAEDNVYSFDIQTNSPFISSTDFASSLSSSITVQDIESLLKLDGYTYEIKIEANVEQGYVVATVYLKSNNQLYEDTTINPNNVKTLYLYNFATPSGTELLKNITIISASIAAVIFIVLIAWHTVWGRKVSNYKKELKLDKKKTK